MVRHTDCINRSVYLEFRISSIRHLLTTKPPDDRYFFCSQSVGLCSSTSTVIIYVQVAKGSKPRSEGSFSQEHVRPLFNALHWLPVNERIIFKIVSFVFSFLWWYTYYHTCHRVSLYTLPLALSVPAQMKKTFLCKLKTTGYGYRSFSVQAALVWNTLPAHIRHCRSLSQFKTSL